MYSRLCILLLGCWTVCAVTNASQHWVSWTRHDGDISYHESAVISDEDQTIVMIAAEADRIGYDNSVSLHDFKVNLVAIKSVETSECFVTDVAVPDFEAVKEMLLSQQGGELGNAVHVMASLGGRLTDQDIGPDLAEFCHDHNVYRFDVIDPTEERRQVHTPPTPPTPPPFPDWDADFPGRTPPPFLEPDWTEEVSCLFYDTKIIDIEYIRPIEVSGTLIPAEDL